jgi:hypothetical protein
MFAHPGDSRDPLGFEDSGHLKSRGLKGLGLRSEPHGTDHVTDDALR